MKLITQTDKKVFHAVVVPMDATRIRKVQNPISKKREISFITESGTGFKKIEITKDFEIIGIQGGGDSLKEEQWSEIVSESKEYNLEMFPSEAGINLLKSHGFETENPYGDMPKMISYDNKNKFYNDYEEWQQAESKLVRLVILKSDK